MSDISLQIDGKEVTAEAGMTILEAAHKAGLVIPTLCHHEMLQPFGACRMCVVEVDNPQRLVASCVVLAEQGQVVTTRSEKIDRYRKLLLELQLSHAPHSPQLVELAREYKADADRFEKEASFCIHCGLCVRYCAEIKKKNAIGFLDRGIHKEIGFIPEIAARECTDCKECFPLCPTSYLQAAFVLVEAFSCHSRPTV